MNLWQLSASVGPALSDWGGIPTQFTNHTFPQIKIGRINLDVMLRQVMKELCKCFIQIGMHQVGIIPLPDWLPKLSKLLAYLFGIGDQGLLLNFHLFKIVT